VVMKSRWPRSFLWPPFLAVAAPALIVGCDTDSDTSLTTDPDLTDPPPSDPPPVDARGAELDLNDDGVMDFRLDYSNGQSGRGRSSTKRYVHSCRPSAP